MKRLRNFLFKNTSNKQTVAKNTFWLGVGEIGSRLLKLAIFAYAARMLGVSEWGLFSYGLALIGVFSILSDIGINAILQREVARKTVALPSYISAAFFLKASLSFLSAFLLFIFSFFVTSAQLAHLIPIVSILLFIDSIREFGFALNRANEQMEREAIIKLLTNALLVGIAYFTISTSATAISLILAYIYAGLLSLVLLIYTLRSYLTTLHFSFDRSVIKKILIESWPIGVVAVFGTILSSIDTLILGWFTDSTQVGYYAAAQKPTQILWLIPGLLTTAILPLFSRNTGKGDEHFSDMIGRSITASFVILIPLVLLCVVSAKMIIFTLFGSAYLAAVPLVQILAFGLLATVPSMFLSNALLAYGKQKITLRFIIVGAFSNITLSFLLIPTYGVYGAAISYTASQIISNTFMVYKTRSIPALRFKINLSHLKSDIASLLNH